MAVHDQMMVLGRRLAAGDHFIDRHWWLTAGGRRRFCRSASIRRTVAQNANHPEPWLCHGAEEREAVQPSGESCVQQCFWLRPEFWWPVEWWGGSYVGMRREACTELPVSQ